MGIQTELAAQIVDECEFTACLEGNQPTLTRNQGYFLIILELCPKPNVSITTNEPTMSRLDERSYTCVIPDDLPDGHAERFNVRFGMSIH